MSTDAITRTVQPFAVYTGPPSQPGTGTELAQPQAVTPADPSGKTRGQPDNSGAGTPQSGKQVGYAIDASTSALIFQIQSASSGAVIFQLPSEDALRLRAYQAQEDKAKAAHQSSTESRTATSVKA